MNNAYLEALRQSKQEFEQKPNPTKAFLAALKELYPDLDIRMVKDQHYNEPYHTIRLFSSGEQNQAQPYVVISSYKDEQSLMTLAKDAGFHAAIAKGKQLIHGHRGIE